MSDEARIGGARGRIDPRDVFTNEVWRRRLGPPPLLGRPALDVAVDVVRASIYVGLVLWAYAEPAGTGAFVFGGFVFADVTSWVVFGLGQIPFRPTAFAVEFLGYAALMGLLSRAGAFEIGAGREGEALAISFLSCVLTFWIKFGSFWLRGIQKMLEDD
jgi:hypothetical protein